MKRFFYRIVIFAVLRSIAAAETCYAEVDPGKFRSALKLFGTERGRGGRCFISQEGWQAHELYEGQPV